MIKLYDLGFISDPTKFNRKEILANIVELEIDGLVDIKGRILLTSHQVGYAMRKNKESEEAFLFLSLLRETLKYKEYSDSLDVLYEEFFKGLQSVKLTFGLKYKVGNVYSKYPLSLNKGVFECFVGVDQNVVEYNINDEIWNIAMKVLGIPEEDWLKDGLFDKHLTHDEEVKFIDILLDGVVDLDGLYSEVLVKWLSEHKWSEQKLTINEYGLYKYLFTTEDSYIISEKVKEKIASIQENGDTVLYFNYGVIYATAKRDYIRIPVSQFVLTYDEDVESLGHPRNNVEEYTGEAYCKSYLDNNNIQYVGCPIELYVEENVVDYFIDVEQTEMTHYRSWFDVSTARLDFEDGKLVQINDSYPLDTRLKGLLKNSEKGETVGVLKYNFTEKEMLKAKTTLYQSLIRTKDES